MASISAVVRVALENTSALTTLLTGGIFDASELGRLGLSPSTSGLYNGDVLKPCAVIRWRATNPYGPHYGPQSQRRSVEIYVYEDDGYNTIESALYLIKQTLHRTQLDADNGGLWWVNWTYTSGELDAPELGNAAMQFARFEVIYTEEL